MNTVALCRRQIDYLIRLLKIEIAQLKKGDFVNLQQQSDAKLQGIKQLDQLLAMQMTAQEKDTLKPLITKLNRLTTENGLLLKGIYNGTKAAQARIEAIRKNEINVGVYGRKGEALTLTESYPGAKKSV